MVKEVKGMELPVRENLLDLSNQILLVCYATATDAQMTLQEHHQAGSHVHPPWRCPLPNEHVSACPPKPVQPQLTTGSEAFVETLARTVTKRLHQTFTWHSCGLQKSICIYTHIYIYIYIHIHIHNKPKTHHGIGVKLKARCRSGVVSPRADINNKINQSRYQQ